MASGLVLFQHLQSNAKRGQHVRSTDLLAKCLPGTFQCAEEVTRVHIMFIVQLTLITALYTINLSFLH